MPRSAHSSAWRELCAGLLVVSPILIAASGCQHRPPPSAISSGMNLSLNLPPPTLAVATPILTRRSPRQADPKWLDLDVFFPPGAKRVGPARAITLELAPERRTRFPSTDLCPSPDKRIVLFHDGIKRGGDIYHWLMLLKHDAPNPNAIFLTIHAFDVTWSEESRRFAVTHFVGDNSSEVFFVDTADLRRNPLDVRPQLEEYFPAYLLSGPMFLKAYRWTRDGRLILRGIGRNQEPPYEFFGCEVVIAFDPEAEPKITFLRGYLKPQEESDRE